MTYRYLYLVFYLFLSFNPMNNVLASDQDYDRDGQTTFIKSRVHEVGYGVDKKNFKWIESEIHTYISIPPDERGMGFKKTIYYPFHIQKPAYDLLKNYIQVFKDRSHGGYVDEYKEHNFYQKARNCFDKGWITCDPGYDYVYNALEHAPHGFDPNAIAPDSNWFCALLGCF